MSTRTLKTSYRIVATALGEFAFVFRAETILRSYLPDRDRETLQARILGDFPGASAAKGGAWGDQIAAALVAFARGEADVALKETKLAWDEAPEFHQRVWRAVRKLGPGKVMSYGEVAKLVGEPKAARAVGQAMARNKFPPFVPCHRVLAASRKPGGFSAFTGTQLKGKFLAREGVVLGPEWN